MAEGRWNTTAQVEQIRQGAHMRGRFIPVYTGPSTDVAFNPVHSDSAYAGFSPADGSIPSAQSGPHFTLNPVAPGTGLPTRGFEAVLTDYCTGNPATASGQGFTVTVWKLLENLQIALGTVIVGPWAYMSPITNVPYRLLFRTFDVDACSIRFQIGNIASDGYMLIYMTELG